MEQWFPPDLLRTMICPVSGCGAALRLRSGRSLMCRNRHTFDLAKPGYVHFHHRPADGQYNRQLFQARRALYRAGFWNPLLDRLAERIARSFPASSGTLRLLDAGCGEGSLLAGLTERLAAAGRGASGAGLDLAKEGVRLAAKTHRGPLWCVADLARAPFADRSFHVVTNVLSPANYAEFARLLTAGGLAIKVVPGPDYLRELRAALYGPPSGRPGGGAAGGDAAALFCRRMPGAAVERIRYDMAVDEALAGHLARMTPLAWQAGVSSARIVPELLRSPQTIDLLVLCGGIDR